MSESKSAIQIVDIPINTLSPLPNNPFDLYEGQRLEDLVESIETDGVLVPIMKRKG